MAITNKDLKDLQTALQSRSYSKLANKLSGVTKKPDLKNKLKDIIKKIVKNKIPDLKNLSFSPEKNLEKPLQQKPPQNNSRKKQRPTM